MNTEAFKATYAESRNGINNWVRHPLFRNFLYSDGVRDLAESGCYWLIDIMATELPAVFKANPRETFMIVKVKVAGSKARIEGSLDDDSLDYRRKVDYTDMPDGTWMFYVMKDDPADPTINCILPTEY